MELRKDIIAPLPIASAAIILILLALSGSTGTFCPLENVEGNSCNYEIVPVVVPIQDAIPQPDFVQGHAEVGKPVQWVRHFNVSGAGPSLDLEFHKNAFNISFRPSGKAQGASTSPWSAARNPGAAAGKSAATGAPAIPAADSEFIGEEGFSPEPIAWEADKETFTLDFHGSRPQGPSADFEAEYYTEAPMLYWKRTPRGTREITISSETHYTNITAFVDIDEITSRPEAIYLYKTSNGARQRASIINFSDTNGNGLIDRIYWIVPHLSNQTYEVIIVTQAKHLDENRTFIADVYDSVKAKDGISALIPEGDYLRITFAHELNSTRDITIYARPAGSNSTTSIEVYGKNGTEPIASFGQIIGYGMYKVLLSDLNDSQKVFDLKPTGGAVLFDYVVDPDLDFEDWESYSDADTTLSGSFWQNLAGDDCDMQTDSAGTTSSNTGPDTDHTLGTTSGEYLYLETSSGWCVGDGLYAWLNGTGYLDADTYIYNISFWYHMCGDTIGTMRLDVYDGTWHNGEWSLSGEQQGDELDPYEQATVDLSGYSGTIQLRFYFSSAGNYYGDMAIDDINISYIESNSAPTTPDTILCDGDSNCDITVDESVTVNASGSTDSDSDAITYVIEASLQNTTSSENTTDASMAAEAGGAAGDYDALLLAMSPDYRFELDGDETDSMGNGASDGGTDPSWVTNIIPEASATQCGDYDGTSSETDIGNEDDINGQVTNQKSISVWVDIDTFDTSNGGRIIWGEGGSQNWLAIYVYSNTLYYTMGESSATTDTLSTSIDSGLHHIGITMDGSAGEAYLYLDGSEADSKTGGLDIGADLAAHTGGIAIGGADSALENHAGSSLDGQFDGRIADVAYFAQQAVLSAANFTSLYEAGVGIGGMDPTEETNTSYTTYSGAAGAEYANITSISVTVEADSFDPRASVDQATNDPDLSLELWNGTDWVVVDTFGLPDYYTDTGLQTTNHNFTIETTNATILSAWTSLSNQSARLRGVSMDYNGSLADEINYTSIWFEIDGKVWVEIGNHTETTALDWDTSLLPEQEGVDLRSRAIDLDGSATYSDYYTKGAYINISHGGSAIEWNQSTLNLGMGEQGEGALTGSANINSTGDNNNIAVVCDSGNCTEITEDWVDTNDMTDGQSFQANFSCSDSATGNFSAIFNVTSIEDTSPDQINVTCNITSEAGNEISACQEITSPGEYNLTANLVGAGTAITGISEISEACIAIQSENVTINCNGYNITNDGTADATAISANGSSALQYPNVTIQNCPGILSYENGISLQYASNSTIRNNTLHNSTGFGLYLSSGTSATIINNSIYNNTQHGILLNLSNNISISASQSYNNTQFGIYISQSNNTNLTSNNITENGVGGIWLDSDSVSNTLSSNYVCTNGVDITNTSASSTGDEDTCDSWNGWEENNHPGCTYRCTNLWHVIYGNSTYTVLVLGEEGDTIFEYAWEGTAYNVYAVNEDNAPSLSWTSLTALGRNTTIEPASDDFTELDTLLGTSSEQDNVENTYSTDGTSPLLTTDRLLHYQSVQYIPISNSTNQSAFVTGILWDLSTDTDTEFSAEDNETIVFWAPINSTASGIYGNYDYEIKVPDTFGTYAPGSSGVNIYLELI